MVLPNSPMPMVEDVYVQFMRKYFPQRSTGCQNRLVLPRTTQIVIEDGFEGLVHRLCEPWDLHGLSTKRTGQSVCWPQECEIIKERIRHIVGIPLEPEPLYTPSGLEETPTCTDAEEGEVVYITNKASSKHFTFSRVGGSAQPLTQAAVNLNRQDNTLIFEARFECGNLQKVVKVGERDYNLTLHTDLYTARHTQWFYFQVQNTRKAVPYRFTIVNLTKSSSLYNRGMKPLLYSSKDASEGRLGWRRVGTHIRYYRSTCRGEGRQFYSLTWTFQFPHDSDTCYFAHCYPYSYSDLQDYLLDVATDPVKSSYCKTRVLCRSLAGNMVYLLTVTNPSENPEAAARKKAVVLTARVHPGESNSSWVMKGFLDHLLGESADAHLLRDTFLFKIVPMLNPDGVIVGNYRCSLSGRDLNRRYRSLLKERYPPVWYTQKLVKRLVEERVVLIYCDLHGHSRKQNVFVYGCQEHGTMSSYVNQRVFPLMLSKNCDDKFSFPSCKFHMKREKEGTGRVMAWRMGVVNSYTLETTFCGSTLGNKRNTHFNVRDLEVMGFHFCDTLLDYCDPDQSKYTQCINQLKNQMKEDIAAKMGIPGAAYDSDAPLSDILSCIESSTTGSNSSESDEPPLKLVGKECAKFPRKQNVVKRRKQLKTKGERETSYLIRKAMGAEKHHKVQC
ncbi:cytosolic carboxypeptidase 3-like [Hypanus sabinus]|uniref:cytosolic carboxypeptidase 3-like n=1 Tax=Hypanus sabinus TaxID=79690 RepID=UPI0028C393F9|nr:cytosolic carboxypeptidase 3-like [Hypanus sabinus]